MIWNLTHYFTTLILQHINFSWHFVILKCLSMPYTASSELTTKTLNMSGPVTEHKDLLSGGPSQAQASSLKASVVNGAFTSCSVMSKRERETSYKERTRCHRGRTQLWVDLRAQPTLPHTALVLTWHWCQRVCVCVCVCVCTGTYQTAKSIENKRAKVHFKRQQNKHKRKGNNKGRKQ